MLLRDAMQDAELQTHDSTLQAMALLAITPREPSSGMPPPAPRQSVFSTWNSVDMASSLNLTEEHIRGLRAVIAAKGGVQNIQVQQVKHLVTL